MSSPQTRPVQPDDLFRLKLIQGAALAPDGSAMVYALSQIADDGEEERIALWLQPIAGGAARQLTAGRSRDFAPRFSPDGRQVAFVSTRDGKPQVYVIAVDGGEARRLTELPQGVVGGPVWSPDGACLAFTAGPPGEQPDYARPYRLTRHVYRFDELGYLDGAVQDIYVVAVGGGEPRRLTDDAASNTMPAWSPDGWQILFSATMQPDTFRAPYPRLRLVSLDGEARDLTGDWGYALSASWLLDGRVVLCGQPYGRPIGSKSDLWVIDGAGGAPECRTADLPLHVGVGLQADMATTLQQVPRVLPTEDGRAAYVQVQDGGTVQIYRVALSGAADWAAFANGERSCFPLDIQNGRLLFAASALDDPLDLYLAGLDGADERRLTHVNADLLSTWQLPKVEHLEFQGADGVPVEGWVMQPATGAKPYPTILYIHGGPHSGFGHIFSFDFQMLAGAGYAVLIVNQRGSTGYGDVFANQIIGDWGNHDYHDLIAGVDAGIARGIADPERLGVCGLSGGGNLSCWIVGQTGRFKAAVPENPVTNWVSFYGVSDIGPWFATSELGGHPHEIPEVYRRCSPITYAHRCTTPTLLIQAEADYRCPAEQSEQFYTVLKVAGCTVEMLRLPASSHAGSIRGKPELRRAQNTALLEWMDRYVLDRASGTI
jgi:dipeptidyl aminopeptidase/acylaminoacyl peptidase